MKAVNQKYTEGLSVWKHRVTINHAKKTKEKVNMEGLIETKAEIDRIVEKEKRDLIAKKKSSKNISKWNKASINGGLFSEKQDVSDDIFPSAEGSAQIVKANLNSDSGISDIGIVRNKCCEVNAERDKSDLERPDKISPGKEGTEFDLSGWGVSSKSEQPPKIPDKKIPTQAYTRES